MNIDSVVNIVEQLKGGLIVSCQALPHEPLHSSFIMAKMAKAAHEGGAIGIRANTEQDIKAIKEQCPLPLIGIVKRDYDDCKVFITATMQEVHELARSGCEIIAIDATCRARPNRQTLADFIGQIRQTYPNLLIMADCASIEEAVYADELGCDFIGTTLVGYTQESEGLCISADDFAILQTIISKVKSPVIAEGNINTPEMARRVLELGAHAVVVGSMITRPQLITAKFVNVIHDVKQG